jgi:hypothetical protein
MIWVRQSGSAGEWTAHCHSQQDDEEYHEGFDGQTYSCLEAMGNVLKNALYESQRCGED